MISFSVPSTPDHHKFPENMGSSFTLTFVSSVKLKVGFIFFRRYITEQEIIGSGMGRET